MSDKILFRCDAGYKSQLGTGHLVRSITIAKILIKKFKVKKKNIIFLIKTEKKYLLGKKIINFEKFRYKSINHKIKNYSLNELKELKKNKFKIVIFDRLGKINLKFIKELKKDHKKIVCLDDESNNKYLCDLSLNPLVYKKSYEKINHFSGNRYNILPTLLFKRRERKISKIKNIFISFGGFDKNNYIKLFYNRIRKDKKFKLINSSYKNLDKFQNMKIFFKNMSLSDLVICSGGLTMYDALNLNKTTIVIDQYKHQLRNINRLRKRGIINYLNKKNINKLFSLINKINKKKKLKKFQKMIIKYNKAQRPMEIIKKINKIYEN